MSMCEIIKAMQTKALAERLRQKITQEVTSMKTYDFYEKDDVTAYLDEVNQYLDQCGYMIVPDSVDTSEENILKMKVAPKPEDVYIDIILENGGSEDGDNQTSKN